MKPETARARYREYPLQKLKRLAIEKFHAFIRERDAIKGCISCNIGRVEQAGHFLSAGHNEGLRFNENNVHGQCIRCNYHLHGNLIEYREGLIKRIGASQVEQLETLASNFKRTGYKTDREALIEIILKYK